MAKASVEARQAAAVIFGLAGHRQEWKYNSNSSSRQYIVLWHNDGKITCDCKGWIFSLRHNSYRRCQHTDMVEWSHGLQLRNSGQRERHIVNGFIYYTEQPPLTSS